MRPNGIRRYPAGLALAWIALFSIQTSDAYSADVQETDNKRCAFRIDGPIVRGDFNNFAQLVQRKLPFNEYDARTSAVCLKSPGGSFDEALRISEFVYNRGMSTVIEFGAECFSACAIIFMAGVVGDQILPFRRLSAGGVLGFHAPYLQVPDQKYSKEELELASQGMTKAVLSLVRLSSRPMKLGGDFIKKSLIQRILEKGKDEVFLIRTIFDAARWNIEIYDAEEHFSIKPATMRGAINMCNNFHFSNMDKPIPKTASYAVQIEEFASKFHRKDFRVLVRDSKTTDVLCELYPKEDKRKRLSIRGCSHDYWSSNSFGDCREYKTRPTILIGKYVPLFFALEPGTLLKRFSN